MALYIFIFDNGPNHSGIDFSCRGRGVNHYGTKIRVSIYRQNPFPSTCIVGMEILDMSKEGKE
jgi:hypothetical protein